MKTHWNKPEWNRHIYLDDGRLYMQRWMLDFWRFSIRLHKFSESDDPRALHDHPWWFVTLILSGGYLDVTHEEDGSVNYERMGRFSFRYRPMGHKHTVKLLNDKPSWSIVLTGRQRHRWGFYVKNKLGEPRFVNSKRYFLESGHH